MMKFLSSNNSKELSPPSLLTLLRTNRNVFLIERYCQVDYGNTNRVPTQTGKPGKWEGIFQSGKKSWNFNQTGKVREK